MFWLFLIKKLDERGRRAIGFAVTARVAFLLFLWSMG